MAHISWNRQLALAAALFGLGTAAFWLEYKHKPAKESLEENEKKLFQVKDLSVKSITLVDAGKSTVLSCLDLSKQLCKPGENSKWEILEPAKLKADDANVNALLSSLNSASTENVIDLKEETPEKRTALLKEYGLNAEARQAVKKVIVSTEKGDTVLYLGNPHPIGESFFALEETVAAGQKAGANTNENRVYLVPNFFKSGIEHDLKHWHNKKLMTVASSEISSFDLQGSKGALSGAKKDGNWVLNDKSTKQSDLPGDSENIDSFLSSVTYLTAQDFVADQKDDPKGKALLKGLKPALTLTLLKEGPAQPDKAGKEETKTPPTPITLSFYPSGTKLYATVSNLDPVFSLDPGTKNRLDKAAKDLRMAKLATAMDRFSTKRLEFVGKSLGATPLVLTNSDGKWVFETDKIEADDSKVSRLLEKLSSSRISDFVSAAAIPAGEADGIQLTLGDDKNASKRHFAFWKKGDRVYARDLQSKRKEAFVMEPSFKDWLPWEKGFFTKAVAPQTQPSPLSTGGTGPKK